ncbi:carcinine transporter-like [Plodia interpunctella]|uniref:carcinine transporter-like n=1 Tax=Plodia interpunctella TaxID=58824 RepID=UPI002368DB39|nr:carcinine transporter-like [Plodia interpunctella]
MSIVVTKMDTGCGEFVKDRNPIETENNVTNTEDEVDYDKLLSTAGKFGLYQIILFISTFPFYLYGVFMYYSQLFMTEVSPNHWCWVPELENMTELERRTLAIPLDSNAHFGYSQCKVYSANWSEVLRTGVRPDESWETIPCQHGWEFNKSEIPYPTISSELGWVCDKNSYQASAQAIFFIGSTVGGFIVGWIADRFGRLPAIVVSNVIGCVAGLASTFARNFIEFSICRFFTGMSYDNCMMMAYLIILEYVAPQYRTLLSNLSFALFYSASAVAMPWIVLASGHWKTISIVTSVPLALAVLSPFFIPESPRWLLSKGRTDEAVEKILTIGRVNKKEIPLKLIEQFKSSVSNAKKEDNYSAVELLKRPTMRVVFIAICIVYMCCMIAFDGLIRCLKQLEFDYFISFSLVSFTEFPSMVLTAFILDWTGRRWLTVVMSMASCVFSIMIAMVDGEIASVVFAVIARFCVNIACSAATQWTAEILPVSVRGSGVSVVHICGYIATVLSPYIAYLDTYIYWLPLVLIGCIAAGGGLVALLIPETANKDMPQTFEDAERLVKTAKFWEVPFLTKRKKKADLDRS